MHLRDSLIPKYSELIYNGFWFSPGREALHALVTETQRDVTGVVRLKLYKRSIIVMGRPFGEPATLLSNPDPVEMRDDGCKS
jgi:argininosuccinate synthase